MSFPGRARQSADVVVVGAGAIGAAIALELGNRGRDVAVLERGADWAAGCSWGNAGLICPSHAGPWARTEDIALALRWMLRPDSPLGIKPSPSLVPFMTRLLSYSSDEVERATEISRAMCRESLAMHKVLATTLDTDFHQSGLLDVYVTESRLERGLAAAAQHRAGGINCEELDGAAIRRLEPALSRSIVGGVMFPDEAHCDPARYVEAVGARAQTLGAQLKTNTNVLIHRRLDGRTHSEVEPPDAAPRRQGLHNRPRCRRPGTVGTTGRLARVAGCRDTS